MLLTPVLVFPLLTGKECRLTNQSVLFFAIAISRTLHRQVSGAAFAQKTHEIDGAALARIETASRMVLVDIHRRVCAASMFTPCLPRMGASQVCIL
jgi:hypothetical protein